MQIWTIWTALEVLGKCTHRPVLQEESRPVEKTRGFPQEFPTFCCLAFPKLLQPSSRRFSGHLRLYSDGIYSIFAHKIPKIELFLKALRLSATFLKFRSRFRESPPGESRPSTQTGRTGYVWLWSAKMIKRSLFFVYFAFCCKHRDLMNVEEIHVKILFCL